MYEKEKQYKDSVRVNDKDSTRVSASINVYHYSIGAGMEEVNKRVSALSNDVTDIYINLTLYKMKNE